jgi:tRNA pseudouridine38-40 synthase
LDYTGPKRIHVPKAPPLGLLLESPQFKTYNTRVIDTRTGTEDDRETVTFDPYEEKMKDFKLKWIYERLRQDELEQHV